MQSLPLSTSIMPVNMGERHRPVVILVDCSDSMRGEGIQAVNNALLELKAIFRQKNYFYEQIDISILSFTDSLKTELHFCPMSDFIMPDFTTGGGSAAQDKAIDEGLRALAERKRLYGELGISYYRPILMIFSRWMPTNVCPDVRIVCKLQQLIKDRRVLFCPFQVSQSNEPDGYQWYYPDNWENKLILESARIQELFLWYGQLFPWNGDDCPQQERKEMKITLPPFPINISI